MSELDTIFDKAKQSLAGFDQLQTDAKLALEKSKRDLAEVNRALAEASGKHQKLMSELAAKKDEADKAGEEAARRIKVGNDQAAELMRVKAELEKRERAVEKRENEAQARVTEAVSHLDNVQKREQEVARRETELKTRFAKLREAMA